MKKQFLIAMAALSMVTLAGCSGNTAETTAAATTAAATTEAATEAETTAEATEAATEAEEALDPDSRLAKVLESGKLVIGTSPDFAPMEFKDVTKTGDEMYVGSDMAMARYIAEAMGLELEIKAMEFSAIQQAVNSGTIDCGISGFAYTAERAENYGTSILYNVVEEDEGHTVLVMKGEGANYDEAADFSGKKVLAQNASLQQSLVSAQLPTDIEFQPVTTVTDGVLMIINDKADALAVSHDNGEMLVAAYPEVEMTTFKFDHEDDGNIILMKKGEDELVEAINEVLAEINESGIYETWTEEAQALAESLGIE
ncbi:MAG: transporter substrate-binding domain-containing protein [Lachnospiraceae bacterium]|nr:transporter substrate-binding domain-containing protein [Lachnospiraceae bacterium]